MNDDRPNFTVAAWTTRLDEAWRCWAKRERTKPSDEAIVAESPIADEPIIVSER